LNYCDRDLAYIGVVLSLKNLSTSYREHKNINKIKKQFKAKAPAIAEAQLFYAELLFS
jgi:hypothetical protein